MRLPLPRFFLIALLFPTTGFTEPDNYLPGNRVLLDAHNCYPYEGLWADRIDRALSTGAPLAMEPDLDWAVDPITGAKRSIVSHGQPHTGEEPTLSEYFFERIRPQVEAALAAEDTADWPLITLNIDFKNSEPDHVASVAAELDNYRDWLSSAVKSADPAEVTPIEVRPVLILLNGREGQQEILYDRVPVGGNILAFGAVRQNVIPIEGTSREERMRAQAQIPPEHLVTEPASNFRRWWNNSWYVIEEGGAPGAGDWTAEEEARLRSFTQHAHAMGYWIRFYTLNGHSGDNGMGWSEGYNFGSREAAEIRWRAAIEAGVDFVASDQYEDFSKLLYDLR